MKHIILANQKLIEEAMTQDEWKVDAEKAAEYFVKEIQHLFPNAFSVKAKLEKGLGYHVTYSYVGDEWKVTRHNAKERIEFMMHLGGASANKGSDTEQDKFDIEKLSMSYEFKQKGLKPRKISGKSPMDATKKLVDWFKKNKAIIAGTTEHSKVKEIAAIDQTQLKRVIQNTKDSDYELLHTYTYHALEACCDIVRKNVGLPLNDMPKAYLPKDKENGKIYFGSKKSMIPFFYAIKEGEDKYSLYELTLAAYTRLGF